MCRTLSKVVYIIFLGIFLMMFLLVIKGIQADEIGEYKDYNLIMISLSNVGTEHMSLYGYKRITTPRLNEWAKDAIVFENTFVPASWTLPVATSLFTSLYPYTHGVMHRYVNNTLNEDIKTLPEVLKGRGYKTAAFTGGLDYNRRFGHMRGFENYKDMESGSVWPTSIVGFSAVLEKATKWIDKKSKEKFFLFLHAYDLHCPFDPPEKFKGTFSRIKGKNITVDNALCLRGYQNSQDGTYIAYYHQTVQQKEVILAQDDIDYLRNLYDEEILTVDDLIGNFLDSLDKTTLDHTIIVIFSDHGEMFAKHGRFGRAGMVRGTLYDEVTHVPLIIKIPGQKGKTVEGLTQIIDVMPTLLNILGLSVPDGTQGKNLIPMMTGAKESVNEFVFAGSKYEWFRRSFARILYPVKSINASIRDRRWKLIYEIKEIKEEGSIEETYELFDVLNDPDELHNLIDKEVTVTSALKRKLSKWSKESRKEFFQNKSREIELPEKLIERAKKMGYW